MKTCAVREAQASGAEKKQVRHLERKTDYKSLASGGVLLQIYFAFALCIHSYSGSQADKIIFVRDIDHLVENR